MTQSPPTGELVARATEQLRSFGAISDNVGKDLIAYVTTLERELEEARAALKLMHRRAQSAEGQAEAARYELNMWNGHPVMSTPGGYLASEVAKSGLKALNRRAALQDRQP